MLFSLEMPLCIDTRKIKKQHNTNKIYQQFILTLSRNADCYVLLVCVCEHTNQSTCHCFYFQIINSDKRALKKYLVTWFLKWKQVSAVWPVSKMRDRCWCRRRFTLTECVTEPRSNIHTFLLVQTQERVFQQLLVFRSELVVFG